MILLGRADAIPTTYHHISKGYPRTFNFGLIRKPIDSLSDESALNIELPAESLILEGAQHVLRFAASTDGFPFAGEVTLDYLGERIFIDVNGLITKVILIFART